MQIENPHLYYLVDQFNTNPAVAFVINSTSGGQKVYSLFNEINKQLDHDSKIELSAYCITRELPIILPNFGIYNTIELNDFCGHLIATNLHTLSYVTQTDRTHKYFYVYDIHEVLGLSAPQLDQLKGLGIKIFTRNADYRKALIEKGLDVSDTFVGEFNITEIFKELSLV